MRSVSVARFVSELAMRRRCSWPGPGVSLLELVVVLGLLSLALGIALPALSRLQTQGRVDVAARQVAVELQALRWRSVSRGQAHGWWYQEDDQGWFWQEVLDGDGDGVGHADIADGTDGLGPLRRLERSVGGVRGVTFGLPDDIAIPRIPPAQGWLDRETPPLRFGNAQLIVFSPQGSSSSGTLFVTDGSDLAAVVLFGPTGRMRVWHFNPRRGIWRR